MRSLILSVVLLISGCATGSGSGTHIDTVSQGQPLPGAHCAVRAGAESFTVQTPATVVLPYRSSDLHIVCDMPGYRVSELIVQDLPGAAYGWPGSSVGVGVAGGSGGRIGMGIGFGFPFVTGVPGNPRRIIIEMTPTAVPTAK